jgi:hypothetical protein
MKNGWVLGWWFALLLLAGCQGSAYERCPRQNDLEQCSCGDGGFGYRRCSEGWWGQCDCRLDPCERYQGFEACYDACGLDGECGRFGRCARLAGTRRGVCSLFCTQADTCPLPERAACLGGQCARRCDPADPRCDYG